ncbi:hypothetical protein SC171_21325 [Pantoea cypripedii]|uniref:hypothetical protein n=1 Tax=Pantoea cypripedii TaxID=55209 RepID=UPI002FC7FF6E
MATFTIGTAATQAAFPTQPDHKKVANDNADSHKQTENLLTSQTHQDDLHGLGLSLGEMPDEPGNRLSENTHDLESHLKTFMPEDKKGPLTLICLNDKGHLSSAITLKSDENSELTFQQSAITPGGTLSETRTGSLHNADDKNDLLQALNSGSFKILSEAKTDSQYAENNIQPVSSERPPVSHKKSTFKHRHADADQLSHKPKRVNKNVSFSPDKATVMKEDTTDVYYSILKKGQDIVGAIDAKNENMTFDKCELIHKPGTNKNMPVLKSDSGNLEVKNGSVILNKIMSTSGEINVDNALTADDIINIRGEIHLHSVSVCSGTLHSIYGDIECSSSSAGAIKNKYGNTYLNKATITEDVDAGHGFLTINSSTIKGTLTAYGDDLTIGDDCKINCLVIKKDNSPGRAVSSLNNGEASVQNITLGAGTTLNNISFESDFCFLTLEGNASYTGPRIPGLEITRVP